MTKRKQSFYFKRKSPFSFSFNVNLIEWTTLNVFLFKNKHLLSSNFQAFGTFPSDYLLKLKSKIRVKHINIYPLTFTILNANQNFGEPTYGEVKRKLDSTPKFLKT